MPAAFLEGAWQLVAPSKTCEHFAGCDPISKAALRATPHFLTEYARETGFTDLTFRRRALALF